MPKKDGKKIEVEVALDARAEAQSLARAWKTDDRWDGIQPRGTVHWQ